MDDGDGECPIFEAEAAAAAQADSDEDTWVCRGDGALVLECVLFDAEDRETEWRVILFDIYIYILT